MSPAKVRSKVVFPQPLGPTTDRNSRGVISKLSPEIAWIRPPLDAKATPSDVHFSRIVIAIGT
jgi:hypothetical protein